MFRAEQHSSGAAHAYATALDTGRVRSALPADLAALLVLEQHFPCDRLSRQSFRRLLRSTSAELQVYEEAGQVVGNAVLLHRRNSTQARIYSLIVHPDCQGRGIARTLLDSVECAAMARGCRALCLEVRADNAPALRLYQKAGFQVVRQITGYYQDHATALRLEKSLPGSV